MGRTPEDVAHGGLSMNDQPPAPGWDAITDALRRVYGNQEPKHWGNVIPAFLGGKDPLHGISAYRSDKGGAPHWHLVTFGLTELWGKESDDGSTSGYGFELTMRLACDDDEETPPNWVLNFLQILARYVFNPGAPSPLVIISTAMVLLHWEPPLKLELSAVSKIAIYPIRSQRPTAPSPSSNFTELRWTN